MKPADTYTGFHTYDLTACVVHALVREDGSTDIVARYPKTWLQSDKREINTVSGPMQMRQFAVTEWNEVVLKTIPAPG